MRLRRPSRRKVKVCTSLTDIEQDFLRFTADTVHCPVTTVDSPRLSDLAVAPGRSVDDRPVWLPVLLVAPAAGFGMVAVSGGPHRVLVFQPGADRAADGGQRADDPGERQVVGGIDRPLQGLFQYGCVDQQSRG